MSSPQDEAMAKLGDALTAYAQENVIGRQTRDLALDAVNQQVGDLAERAGLTDTKVVSAFAWTCPWTEEVQDTELPEGEIEIARCDWMLEDPVRLRKHPLRWLRLKRTGTPGKCPHHGRTLHSTVINQVSGRIPMRMTQMVVTIKPED